MTNTFLVLLTLFATASEQEYGETRLPSGGRILYRDYKSDALGRREQYSIYLPAQYFRDQEHRFPVLYFLHGMGHDDRLTIDVVGRFLDKAIDQGRCRPIVMVAPDAGARSDYLDWPRKEYLGRTVVIEELIPTIDCEFRTLGTRRGRAITGFSMGGGGAIRLALQFPALFASVSSIGGFPAGTDELVARRKLSDAEVIKNYRAADILQLTTQQSHLCRELPICLVVGTQDINHPWHAPFHSYLVELGYNATCVELPDVGHDQDRYLSMYGDALFSWHARQFAD